MELDEVMSTLEAEGTAQNRKIYARHGAQEPMFGVSYGALGKLEKKIKTDHELGLALWDSGNHDARMLAAKVVDPGEFTTKLADGWARAAVCYQTAGAVADVVAESPVAGGRCDAWRDRKGEWVASAGWGVLARTCEDEDLWSIADLRGLVRQVEEEIHDRPNRVRHEMNMALICIALRNAALQRLAMSAGRHIGEVVVDHGETNCSTPDACDYIEKTVGYRQRRAVRSG
ncbi:MAG: DNA alkylation repair protein [Acidimicrobiales bacterium]|jgi:3-methyladenine DNA glycosylase AlkD|nr:DNA alkylation repair protein [Acidimicrobiales bacterium]